MKATERERLKRKEGLRKRERQKPSKSWRRRHARGDRGRGRKRGEGDREGGRPVETEKERRKEGSSKAGGKYTPRRGTVRERDQ